MSKKGLTPVDCRVNLHKMVTLVFSGLHKEDGVLKEKSGESEFLEEDIYKAIHQLSQEFPEFFPGYFVEMMNGIPYCGLLEDILYVFGALNVIRHGSRGYKATIIISEEIKKKMTEEVLINCAGRKLTERLMVVQRFNKFMEENTETARKE